MAIATVNVPQAGSPALPAAARRVRLAMDRDGAVSLRGLFPRALLERVRAHVLRGHESGRLRREGLIRDIGGRYAALLPFEGPFLDPRFYADPRLHRLLCGLLGESYCIGSLEAVISLPGASRQHQHIDGPLRLERLIGGRKRPFPGDLSRLPPYAVTLCVPLCDLGEENGATAIWAGSHRAALGAKPPGERALSRRYAMERMCGEFGRCFFFDYRVFHCGMPNFSREPRPVVMFVFTRGWFRDPNLAEVRPRVAIRARDLAKVATRRRPLFALAPAARRALWKGEKFL